MNSSSPQAGKILFLSHGGGPLPLLGDPDHAQLVAFLAAVGPRLATPAAIVVVSAHWEADYPLVTSGATPPLIYDYYGFPEESYHIQYPAPGHPELASRIRQLLTEQGLPCGREPYRGFDHGLFVPLKLMFPRAQVPCVQLSLVNTLDPALHLQIGEALRPLLADNILLIGSGFSFHNLKAFFAPPTAEGSALNQAFEAWLVDTCGNREVGESTRRERLMAWQQAPGARYCHPREEHLLPLHVCCGAAGRAADETFAVQVLGKQSSAYLWV